MGQIQRFFSDNYPLMLANARSYVLEQDFILYRDVVSQYHGPRSLKDWYEDLCLVECKSKLQVKFCMLALGLNQEEFDEYFIFNQSSSDRIKAAQEAIESLKEAEAFLPKLNPDDCHFTNSWIFTKQGNVELRKILDFDTPLPKYSKITMKPLWEVFRYRESGLGNGVSNFLRDLALFILIEREDIPDWLPDTDESDDWFLTWEGKTLSPLIGPAFCSEIDNEGNLTASSKPIIVEEMPSTTVPHIPPEDKKRQVSPYCR